EFIELLNITAAAVPLYDPANPTNTWQLSDGVTFSFPQGVSLAANGYALVVPIAPATFRSKYNIDPSIPIYGPYTGALNNGGETVELSKPDAPVVVGGNTVVPYLRVDHVHYDPVAPWPTFPDGTGSSLGRFVSANYGNDAINWRANKFGGTPGTANVVLDTSPPNVPTGLAASLISIGQVNLTWNAASDLETGVSLYKIYRNGQFLASTAA